MNNTDEDDKRKKRFRFAQKGTERKEIVTKMKRAITTSAILVGTSISSIRSQDVTSIEAAPSDPVLYGYDVVSYFGDDGRGQGGKAVKGSDEFRYHFVTQDCGIGNVCVDRFNSTFYFSSEENRDAFEANPWKYAPRWGGF